MLVFKNGDLGRETSGALSRTAFLPIVARSDSPESSRIPGFIAVVVQKLSVATVRGHECFKFLTNWQ